MRKSPFFVMIAAVALVAVWGSAAISTAQAVQSPAAVPLSSMPPAVAQSQPRGPRPIEVQRLTPNIYWVRNIGFGAFIVGDKGVILIDTGGSPAVGKQILDAVAKVTTKPVTTVILTHGDGDHVNGLSAFPANIQIIAQENCKKALEAALAAGNTGAGSVLVPADHLPNHVVANREDATIDGVKLQLLHWAPAHTPGDLIIYLPAEKIVLAGDLIVMDQHSLPLIHRDKGGTSKGWVTSVQGVLALDASLYVVGHEGAVIRDVLEKQLQATIAEREKIKELYDKGVPLAQIEAEVGDPPPSQNAANGPGGGPRFPPFSEVVYQELKDGTY
jgi:glyoxylase-like metal-dependent hydrolase (beta-lactamase superfamily II)